MKSCIFLFFGFLLSVALYSQSVTKFDDLEFIPGTISTYYAKGYKEKAEYLKILIEDAVSFYEDVLKDTFSFDLFILDRKNWKQYTKAPYPIAHYINDKKRMIMPVFSYYKIHLSDGDSIYGKEYYYLSDFIAIHELGHYITHKQDAKSHSKWSGEFFADFTLIAYLHEIIPGFEFDDKPADYFRFLPLKYKTLEKFGSAGILNELAYHPKFQELADQIYLKHGLSFMHNWLEMYNQLNKDIKDGKFDNITFTSEQIFQNSIKDIQSIEPDIFNEWNKSMRQTYHSWLILFGLVILIGIIGISNTSYSIFTSLELKTRRIHRIFGVPAIRIWYNLKNIKSKSIKYKLIRISVLRILNFFLVTILILSIALMLV
jgi:hypothetical protein